MSPVDPFAVDAAAHDPSVADSLNTARLSDLLVAARPASPDPAFAAALDSLERRELVALVMTYLLVHNEPTAPSAA